MEAQTEAILLEIKLLQDAIGFSLSDLADNRLGLLSAGQSLLLRRQIRTKGAISATLLAAAIAVGALFGAPVLELVITLCAVYYIGSAVLLLVDRSRGTVRVIDGLLQRGRRSYFVGGLLSLKAHNWTVGVTRVAVSAAAYHAAIVGLPHRVCITPLARLVVSAEPLLPVQELGDARGIKP